jgi:hypothetical protein
MSDIQNLSKNSRFLFYIRGLFPTWEFFSDSGSCIEFYIRYGKSESHLSRWTPPLKPIERRLSAIFFNPEGNLKHALNTHLLNFINDINGTINESTSDTIDPIVKVQNLTTYLITAEWAKSLLPDIIKENPAQLYCQFQIQIDHEIFFESEIHLIKNISGME